MFLKFYSKCVLLLDIYCIICRAYSSVKLGLWHILFPPAQKSVNGDIIVIVGIAQGIGKQLALQLVRLGAKVAIWDKDARACVDLVRLSKGKIYAYFVDVTKRDKVLEAAVLVRELMGPIKMVINCCNMPSIHDVFSEPSYATTLSLSILSPFWIVEAVLPQMLGQKEGHVVFLSSLAGPRYFAEKHIPLAFSQFALQGFAENLRQEMTKNHRDAKIEVTVVHIYPLLVSPELLDDIREKYPLIRCIKTWDPSKAARQVIKGVRQGISEFGVPGYLFHVSNLLRLVPSRIMVFIRSFTGKSLNFG